MTKEDKVKKLVKDLKTTVATLNKLDKQLYESNISYTLHRSRVDQPYELTDVVQRIEYK